MRQLEVIDNRATALYYRGQATKARKKCLKWIMKQIDIPPTQNNVYFVLKKLKG